MKLIVANWKANKTKEEAVEWWAEFSSTDFLEKNIQVVICPPAVYLWEWVELLKNTKFPFALSFGVQDISRYPGGTYTGEITARMLKGVVSHVFVGHSERRKWFGDTSQIVAMKARMAMDNDMTPIVLFSRENYREQLGQFNDTELAKMWLMYEPPEAISALEGSIGIGQSAAVSDVEQMVKNIQALAFNSKVLYGGSVKSANVAEYISLVGIDGVGVGSASLDVREFIKLIKQI